MKKRILYLILILSITITISMLFYGIAYALKWFSPYDGYAYAYSNRVSTGNLKWSSSSVSGFKWWDAWEGEFRKYGGGSIKGVYKSLASTWNSNLPGRYREMDNDDVTIGCASVHILVAGNSYYGYTYLVPASPQGSFTGYFESELGYDYGGIPPIPQDWEQLGSTFQIPDGGTSW